MSKAFRPGVMCRQFIRGAVVALAACLVPPSANAQSGDYPSKIIRLVVPQSPGGSGDTFGRTLAEHMSKGLGVQIIVENRPGASSSIGMELVARSAPDGYTLIIASSTGLMITPLMMPGLRIDPQKDLEPIGILGEGTILMVAHPDFPAKDLPGVVALAKEKPDEIGYATWGIGSPAYICMQKIISDKGIRMNHVPYKSGTPLVADMVAGHIKFGFADAVSAYSSIQAGKLKVLASCAGRSDVFPATPTFKDQGVDFEFLWRTFLLAPSGTPAPILDRLHHELARVMANPDVIARLKEAGSTAASLGAQPPRSALKPMIERDTAALKAIIDKANITPE